MASTAERKTCYYELLGVQQSATEKELVKGYRKAALKWHPDKNMDNPEEASRVFKQIQEAYKVLTDPHERAWYDSHREQILRGADGSEDDTDPDALHLFAFFTTNVFSGFGDDEGGFYQVYSRVFEEVVDLDRRADEQGDGAAEDPPVLGSSDTCYDEVRVFYAHWRNYVTRRTFAWKDKWNLAEAPDRRVRRLMEKENKKERDKARKEYCQLVRDLARFVRKRDPRVQKHEHKAKAERRAQEDAKLHAKREREQERKRQRQAFAGQERARLAKQELERRRQYGDAFVDAETADDQGPSQLFECVACNKTFKSESQYDNHAKSKKHKQTVAKLKRTHGVARQPAPQHKCSTCGKTCESERLLMEHSQVHEHKSSAVSAESNTPPETASGGESDSSAEPEFYCGVCDCDFPSKKKLKAHNKTAVHQQAAALAETLAETLAEAQPTTTANAEEPIESPRSAASVLSETLAPDDRSTPSETSAAEQEESKSETPLEPAPASAPAPAPGPASAPVSDKTKKKKRRRRRREPGDAQQQGGEDTASRCKVCGTGFPSKTKLFRHLDKTGHHKAL